MKLQEIRTAKGMSQSQLAKKVGISLRVLKAYEQGYRDINRAYAITVYQLAQVLNCSMEDLIEEEQHTSTFDDIISEEEAEIVQKAIRKHLDKK